MWRRVGRGTGVERGKSGLREFYEGGKRERNAKRYLLSFINALQYLKKKNPNDIWLALASSEQSSKQKFALGLKNGLTSGEIVKPFTMVTS